MKELLETILRTSIFLLAIMAMGYISKTKGILKDDEEKVLSSYVYYFAFPSFIIVNLSSIPLNYGTLLLAVGALAPLVIITLIFTVIGYLLRIGTEKTILIILTSIFGNLAFYGIPYVQVTFPGETPLREATLIVSVTLIFATVMSVLTLEYVNVQASSSILEVLINRISRNPLIWSILIGVLISLLGLKIPSFIEYTLESLGFTSGPVAIFMLGAFLYGRGYSSIRSAVSLSFTRIALVPLLTLIISLLLGLAGTETMIVTLMNAMPVAIILAVLSDVYDFYRETVASLILITSFSAPIYLSIWLAALTLFFR